MITRFGLFDTSLALHSTCDKAFEAVTGAEPTGVIVSLLSSRVIVEELV